MGKMRVYEYAKQLNMSSKEILTILDRLNISVNNHMSIIDESIQNKIQQFFTDIKLNAASAKNQGKHEKDHKKIQELERIGKKKVNTETQPKTAQQKSSPHINRNTNKKGQEKANSQRQFHQKMEDKNAPKGNQLPKDNPSIEKDSDVIMIDEDALVVNKNKLKKTKANQKRFDDSKSKPVFTKDSKKKPQPKKAEQKPVEKKTPAKIVVSGILTVEELAKKLNKEVGEIIKKLLFLGIIATKNQEIDMDVITLIADEYNVEVEEKIELDEDQFEQVQEVDQEKDLRERPPVVTIMGHVDHGKTTLLDAIRHTNVTANEAGGITQHIGAYQVEIKGKKITFLDTPGHAAFTTMRARGAQVTDITILVVAADDGVMPQTVEAINHAKAANVPIIVAVNKIDKPGANPDRVKQELTEHGLVPEDWGGDTIFVPVSALKKEGLDDLLEMILLVAEVAELKANPNKRARGTIIEAKLDKGRGSVVTVLVQNGTLKIGDPIVAGIAYGKVRAMLNDKGRRIKEAGPSTPVEITGLNGVPQAGDQFMVFEDERKARAIGEKRAIKVKEAERTTTARVTLDDLYQQIKQGEMKELNVVIKGDVQGSVEALKGSLEKIDIEGVRVKIIHSGVGAITESDIILASASNAIVIGFNVRPDANAKNRAQSEKVDIRLHRIIYNVIDEIEAALKGMLDPEYEEKVIGTAQVRQVFKVSRIGSIAGSYVTEGKITRDAEVRVIRDGVVIFEGKIDSLKRFKDDVREVAQGYECGITIANFNDIKEGDIIEAFVMETVTH
ncbi:translation initiation factor IF-2 [Microaerobacter geothermalis]|uniref:translation initiation factor IF-2 n=1 Tax=Microaerobacter geothermalis TaxID=674972 RepID=UPI001F00925C|nr:translation initiation factor IF-2 [Microaerobacter geothermalis]MCF6093190.1 translation initiation factor IF-2 [Microaerobacter geothermalis]